MLFIVVLLSTYGEGQRGLDVLLDVLVNALGGCYVVVLYVTTRESMYVTIGGGQYY